MADSSVPLLSDSIVQFAQKVAALGTYNDQLDGFLQGDGYTTSAGVVVPSVPALIAEKTAEINDGATSVLAQSTAAADTASNHADTATTAAEQAAASAAAAAESAGQAGSSLPTLIVTSAPANSLGSDGQVAIDPTHGLVYGPKADGAWPAGIPLASASLSPDQQAVLDAAVSATNTSKNDADLSAQAAAAVELMLNTLFMGTLPSDPTVNPKTGQPLQIGSFYYNTTLGQNRTYQGSTAWTSSAPSSDASLVTYLGLGAGAIAYSAQQALRDGGVNVCTYNAVATTDGSVDCTDAFLAAAAVSKATGLPLRVPSKGTATYFVRAAASTLLSGVRSIVADVPFVDGGTLGALIQFAPNVAMDANGMPTDAANDNMACFQLDANTFKVIGICINGPTNYTLTTLVQKGQWLAPETSPGSGIRPWLQALRYEYFGKGFVGWETIEGATGNFERCSGNNLKHSLLLNGNDGHVSWNYCNWGGLASVYCQKATGDYFQLGGGTGGVLVGILYNQTGFQFSYDSGHLGFSPVGLAQCFDSTQDNNQLNGIGGTFKEVHGEQIGEIMLQQLPNCACSLNLISCGLGWSSEVSGGPDGDAAFMLPDNMKPVGGRQQFAMRLGNINHLTAPNSWFAPNDTLPDPSLVAANRYALQFDGMFNSTPGQDAINFESFSGIVVGDGSDATYQSIASKGRDIPRPGYALSTYRASRGDLRRLNRVREVGNLLLSPETYSTSLGLGVAGNVAQANGGNLQPRDAGTILVGDWLANWIAKGPSGGGFSQSALPLNFEEIAGENPWVVKAYPTGNNGFGLNFPCVNGSVSVPRRLVSFGCYILATNDGTVPTQQISLRLEAANNTYPFADTQSETTNLFEPYIYEEFAGGAPGSTNNVYRDINCYFPGAGKNEAVFIVAAMLNPGPLAKYNPNPGPTIDGDEYRTNATLFASSSGTAPVEFARVFFNGKEYRLPLFPV